MSPVYFEVVNFERYQHYRDRCPPWIKLHTAVFDDYEFSMLPDASKWHLAAIWLLASRTKNRMLLDCEWIARRAALNDVPDLAGFVMDGWLRVCDDCKQHASEALARCSEIWRERRGEESRGEKSRGDSALSVIGVRADAATDPDGSPLSAFPDWVQNNKGKFRDRGEAKAAACAAWSELGDDDPLDGKDLNNVLRDLGYEGRLDR